MITTGILFSCYKQHNDKSSASTHSSASRLFSLEQFNKSVKIIPMNRQITKDKNNDEITTMSYKIKNLSDKSIKSVYWDSIYIWNANSLYTHNFPITFEAKLNPQKEQIISEMVLIKKLHESNQHLVKNPNNEIKVEIIARAIEFEDGSRIVIPDN
ncbi:hypothetical protein [Pasteurella sp. PK-2025]